VQIFAVKRILNRVAHILLKIMAECQTNIVNPAHGFVWEYSGAIQLELLA